MNPNYGKILLLFLSLYVVCNCNRVDRHKLRKFPADFKFGAATAAYQIEGAWNKDGKAESIWDYDTHKNVSPILDKSTGDIAADSYHQYKRDVEMMRELGLDYYRFSISWPRILPTCFPNKINQAGVAYYNNLINEMLKYNIEPMVTMYHWDLPQKLQVLGGWTNPYIVDWFAEYARVLFQLFGDRVKTWLTLNEPHIICRLSYGKNYFAPRVNWTGIAEYMCTKNVLLAHAKVYHMYNNEYKATQRGKVGIALSMLWYEPQSSQHAAAAEDASQFEIDIYTHPIFSQSGDFPEIIKRRIRTKSAEQGFPRSRLPEFSPEEVKTIRGSADFLGINHYTSVIVYRNESINSAFEKPSFEDDLDVVIYQRPEWQLGESKMMLYAPWGFYKLLTKLRQKYNNPPIYITENGLATHGGLVDNDRVQYLRGYLEEMWNAIQDGSDVRGYTFWSLLDNFEWSQGYTERFGLYEVDYESPERTRTPRKSAFVYKHIVRTRALDMHYEPTTSIMDIEYSH